MKTSISQKVMDKTMLRISTMTDKALETRIYKTTNIEKLAAMAIVCKQLGMKKIAKFAREKYNFILETS